MKSEGYDIFIKDEGDIMYVTFQSENAVELFKSKIPYESDRLPEQPEIGIEAKGIDVFKEWLYENKMTIFEF
jgi:hypothetical protein